MSEIESVLKENRSFPPTESFREAARVGDRATYDRMYRESVDDPEAFWGRVARELPWIEPPAAESAPRASGFRTRFGSVPEYSYSGKGLMLAGTSEGGPAERAGLIKGDLIEKIDDVVIEGLGDFMYVLNAHKPGDVVAVHYRRGDETRVVRVTLESTQVE